MEITRLGSPNDSGKHWANLQGVIPGGILRARVECFKGEFSHVIEVMVDGKLGHKVKKLIDGLRKEGTLKEHSSVQEYKNDVNGCRIELEGNVFDLSFIKTKDNLTVVGSWYTSKWQDKDTKEDRSFRQRQGMCRLVAGPLYNQVEDAILNTDFSQYEEPKGNVLGS